MDIRRQTFKKSTIINAFKKSGCWPINLNVFTDEDFAPSIATSTSSLHVPNSFPRIPVQPEHDDHDPSVPNSDEPSDSEGSDSPNQSSDKRTQPDSTRPDTNLVMGKFVFELQLSLSQLVADFIDTVPRSWSSTWSWSVVGDAYDSGLPTAAVVVMVGVAGISEELKSGKGNAALSRVCVGTLSRVVVVVADAAPEGGFGARVPTVVAAPAVIVKAVVLGAARVHHRSV
ncbi:hypothetical protein EDB85DRAFT_2159113 [Lactarius pseudohatsudake]|nr:hypothetical protein EDB85DRAFT_2159113 [Lactarius pseudohatsudake]